MSAIEAANNKILWALTPEAANAVKIMNEAGLDRDLALSVLEQFWSDVEIYALDEAVVK